MGFLQKKKQEQSKQLALVSYEHDLVFAHTHSGSHWCVKCQELFFVLFWCVSLTWMLNMASKEKSIPPSKVKKNKNWNVYLMHFYDFESWRSVLAIQKEKSIPKRAERQISFSQQDVSVCPQLRHLMWQKRCSYTFSSANTGDSQFLIIWLQKC